MSLQVDTHEEKLVLLIPGVQVVSAVLNSSPVFSVLCMGERLDVSSIQCLILGYFSSPLRQEGFFVCFVGY